MRLTRWRLGTVLALALALAPMTASANTISGTLVSDSFADWWTFTVGGVVAFSATTTTSADTQLFLFDGTGHGIMGSDGDNAGGEPDYIHTSLGAGTYYLAVSMWDTDPYGTGGGLIFPSHGDGFQYGPDSGDAYSFWSPLPPDQTGVYSVDLTGVTATLDHTEVVATPEPASLTLFGTGLIGLVSRTYKRRRSK